MIGKVVFLAMLTALLVSPLPMAIADEPPNFIKQTFPEQAVDAAWSEYKAVFMDPEAALDAKAKELVALAVSAQVPCEYCVYYHTRAAKVHGATKAEIREAVAAGALVRKWSTMLNGMQYDYATWKSEVDEMFAKEE